MSEQAIVRKSALTYLAAPWMVFSVLTVVLWGAWGLESKFIVDRISPWLNQVVFSVGLVPPLICIFFSKNLRKTTGAASRGAFHGIMTGVLGGAGNICFYLAFARGGKASIVTPFVGLAPLVTVVLALVLLKESLNRAQVFGVFLAVISIVLLSL